MKKTVVIFIFAMLSLNTKADQLAWLSKENAMKATSYLRNQTNVILWCACCEGNNPKQLVTITNVYYEKVGAESDYHVMLEGQNKNNQTIKEELDLAYVHINKDGMAVCLGRELGLECDPCTQPFTYTNNIASINNNVKVTNKENSWAGTYIDEFGRELNIQKPKANGEIVFSVNLSNANCEEGVFTSNVFLENESKAFNSEDDIKIQLIRENNDTIIITEESPLGTHGARCGDTGGTYKRKK